MRKEDIEEIKHLREQVLTLDIRENVNYSYIRELIDETRKLRKEVTEINEILLRALK